MVIHARLSTRFRLLVRAGCGILILACAAFALAFLHVVDNVASVSAGADQQNESVCVPVSDSDDTYGHLFIEADPEGIIDAEGHDAISVELCHQGLELFPDEADTDRSIALCGMMPEVSRTGRYFRGSRQRRFCHCRLQHNHSRR